MPTPAVAHTVVAVAVAAVVAAVAVAIVAAVFVPLAGSWLQQPGTTAPMQPNLLADWAGPAQRVAEHRVQGLHMMPQQQVMELEGT